jgi:hypothetical protein
MASSDLAHGQSVSGGGGSKGVSLFISHHVETHKDAAERIGEILESRSERLTVETCEKIIGGVDWRKWIVEKVAQSLVMLVLLPECKRDCEWIDEEVRQYFAKKAGQSHLVVVTPETGSIPPFAENIQVIRTEEELQKRFLEPLYHTRQFTNPHIPPLNRKISANDIKRDAEAIFEVIRGKRNPHDYCKSLTVDVSRCSRNKDNQLDMTNAVATPSPDWGRILNWDRSPLRWTELCKYTEEDPRKGTFWVKEMENVMNDVAQRKQPRLMSSTFRGRGKNAGKIFRPLLARTELRGDEALICRFDFYEVLAPEFVRDSDTNGHVFGLLYLIGRVRWEVLNPFLVHPYFRDGTLGPDSRLDPDVEKDLIGRVVNSLRTIELEADRQETLANGLEAFRDSNDFKVIEQMFAQREVIKQAIDIAADQNDYKQLIVELKRSLDFNSRAMEIVVQEFARLVQVDREEVVRALEVSSTAAGI